MSRVRGLICDLDGVVFRGEEPCPGAAEAIDDARAAGVRLLFLTNNASRPPHEVVEHLARVGVSAHDAEVLTSSQVAAQRVHDLGLVRPGSVALAVGAGVAERAAEVTTFANAESCMLADSPEPSKPPVTRPTTTTRTRTEPMSAPLLRRLSGLAGPAATSAAGSGTSAHRAGAWLWVTNALDRCRPPRRAWRPARGM